jgi:hypothetical protein
MASKIDALKFLSKYHMLAQEVPDLPEQAMTLNHTEVYLGSLEMRARPNVIFEFGYFVGKLGRQRVCCFHGTLQGPGSPGDRSGSGNRSVGKRSDCRRM